MSGLEAPLIARACSCERFSDSSFDSGVVTTGLAVAQVDVGHLRLGKEPVNRALRITVIDELRIDLSILVRVSPQQQRKLPKLIRILGQDLCFRPAIAFMDIDRASFSKHAFSFKWPVFEQESSLARTKAVQAAPADAAS